MCVVDTDACMLVCVHFFIFVRVETLSHLRSDVVDVIKWHKMHR